MIQTRINRSIFILSLPFSFLLSPFSLLSSDFKRFTYYYICRSDKNVTFATLKYVNSSRSKSYSSFSINSFRDLSFPKYTLSYADNDTTITKKKISFTLSFIINWSSAKSRVVSVWIDLNDNVISSTYSVD